MASAWSLFLLHWFVTDNNMEVSNLGVKSCILPSHQVQEVLSGSAYIKKSMLTNVLRVVCLVCWRYQEGSFIPAVIDIHHYHHHHVWYRRSINWPQHLQGGRGSGSRCRPNARKGGCTVVFHAYLPACASSEDGCV
jgi:hypothetical protein